MLISMKLPFKLAILFDCMGIGGTTYIAIASNYIHNYKVLTVNRNGTIQGHIARRLCSASQVDHYVASR